MTPERLLTYRFFELPYIVRLEIARELGLWDDEDEEIWRDSEEVFDLIFERVRSANVLADLWDRVDEQQDDGEYSTNPFKS